MKKFTHIYLTGCMGCGKSTVGELTARKLGRKLVDLDQMIEKRERKSINQIFKESGEEGFRKIETEVLKSLPKKPLVVATGGGIVLKEENRQIMKDNGAIIWLDVPVEDMVKRLTGDTKRPLLKGKKLKDELEQIMKERRDKYKDCTYRLDAGGLTPLQVSKEIIKYLKK